MIEKQTIYYELLVVRCQRGQKDALQEIFGTWENKLFYYIRRLVDEEQDAWQILQDTWGKVLSGIKKLREPKKLPSWLYKIARNTALGHLRKKYKRQTLFEPDANVQNVQDTVNNITFDDVQQVHFGLGKISLHHREVLPLFSCRTLLLKKLSKYSASHPAR